MVPISVVCEMLVTAPIVSEEFIASILRQYGRRATITRDEDAVLNAKGLGKSMPAEFWTPGSPLFQNPCARYIDAGLVNDLVPRTSESWFHSVCREYDP
jgi:hypothetical protein